jgi:GH35 family endo-1,4-beta-xylanase
MKRIFSVFLLIWACSAKANLIFFGGINDPNLGPFPDPMMWGSGSLHLYNAANTNYSDLQYAVQTDVNTFNWTAFDAMTNMCNTYGLQRMWYGGCAASVTGPWLANFSWDGPTIVQATTNWVKSAAARTQNITYINICNEMWNDTTDRFPQAFGGGGSTGYDWIINLSKLFRQYFPNAKIGINSLNYESAGNDLPYGTYGQGGSNLSQFLPAARILAQAGAIDWIGMEGYSLECCSTANLQSALNQLGALTKPDGTHIGIIMTEFAPDAYRCVDPDTVNADWQRLFPIYYNSPYVWGVLGPWGWRATWNWIAGGCYWFIDDRQSPAVVEPVVSYLQSVLPTAVGGGPAPTPTPTPTPGPGVIKNV